MAKAATKKTTPRVNKELLEARRKRRHEVIGMFCAGIGLVLLLALFSYDRRDPSWGTASARTLVSNWIGPLGANLANTLYQSFGYIALLVPVLFFALAYWLIRYARIQFSWFKAAGLGVILLSLAGLLSVIDSSKGSSFHWGGWIGHLLVYGEGFGLATFLHTVGATIILLLTLITGLMMATPLSLVGLLIQLSEKEQQAGIIATVRERFSVWWQNRQLLRQELAEQSSRERQEREAAARAKDDIKITQPDAKSKGQASVVEAEKKSSLSDVLSPAFSKARASVAAALSREKSDEKSLSELAMTAQSPGSAPAKTPASPREDNSFDDIAEGDEWTDDADSQPLTPGQRSVLEMVSTVSVKRPDLVEEKPVPKPLALVPDTLPTVVEYKLPTTDILVPPAPRSEIADEELKERAIQLAEKCREFNVSGQVKQISPGPVVTTFEFKPDPGVKYSRITGLVDDLCLGLKAESIRIDRIAGKSTVGIEVPNVKRQTIRLREVLESSKFIESSSKLTLALGKTIDGSNYVADLTKMPHLLIAGATGAGKSVALNSILVSLLYKATPDEVKMILVDPKRLELGLYSDIPHLLTPIVTDAKRASYSLRWAVSEMENRYKHLATFGVRNIDQYNHEVNTNAAHLIAINNGEPPQPLPYIVVVIDELADLMMVAARDVEESITRLAQMARAVGIHLVLATQRPSVDVITGLIKANFPSRISFRVSSKVDSRTIIDTNGAEALLGQGDMLFLPPGTSRLVRVHGAYVDEKEVKRICDHARTQGQPSYDNKIVMSEKETEGEELNGDLKRDEKYEEAVRIVIEMGRASTSVLQRRLRIGYGRAASIIDMMHREGIVGPEDGSKPRQVLVKADFLERLDQIQEDEPW
ncbi:MAG: DNA translocase FtsK [Blastocatellia bacterium]|nr:DNA translocase FtsK [Blastocatellia bacterium]